MKIPEPHAWWVKINNVAGAPDSFILDKSGQMWGRWLAGTLIPLRECDLRFCGFEKCCCDPREPGIVNDNCVAHQRNCIGDATTE